MGEVGLAGLMKYVPFLDYIRTVDRENNEKFGKVRQWIIENKMCAKEFLQKIEQAILIYYQNFTKNEIFPEHLNGIFVVDISSDDEAEEICKTKASKGKNKNIAETGEKIDHESKVSDVESLPAIESSNASKTITIDLSDDEICKTKVSKENNKNTTETGTSNDHESDDSDVETHPVIVSSVASEPLTIVLSDNDNDDDDDVEIVNSPKSDFERTYGREDPNEEILRRINAINIPLKRTRCKLTSIDDINDPIVINDESTKIDYNKNSKAKIKGNKKNMKKKKYREKKRKLRSDKYSIVEHVNTTSASDTANTFKEQLSKQKPKSLASAHDETEVIPMLNDRQQNNNISKLELQKMKDNLMKKVGLDGSTSQLLENLNDFMKTPLKPTENTIINEPTTPNQFESEPNRTNHPLNTQTLQQQHQPPPLQTTTMYSLHRSNGFNQSLPTAALNAPHPTNSMHFINPALPVQPINAVPQFVTPTFSVNIPLAVPIIPQVSTNTNLSQSATTYNSLSFNEHPLQPFQTYRWPHNTNCSSTSQERPVSPVPQSRFSPTPSSPSPPTPSLSEVQPLQPSLNKRPRLASCERQNKHNERIPSVPAKDAQNSHLQPFSTTYSWIRPSETSATGDHLTPSWNATPSKPSITKSATTYGEYKQQKRLQEGDRSNQIEERCAKVLRELEENLKLARNPDFWKNLFKVFKNKEIIDKTDEGNSNKKIRDRTLSCAGKGRMVKELECTVKGFDRIEDNLSTNKIGKRRASQCARKAIADMLKSPSKRSEENTTSFSGSMRQTRFLSYNPEPKKKITSNSKKNTPSTQSKDSSIDVKNTDPYMTERNCDTCVLCKRHSPNLTNHFVRNHKTESYVSRLTWEELDELQKKDPFVEEVATPFDGNMTSEESGKRIQRFRMDCPFCPGGNSEVVDTFANLRRHYSTHTGEYSYKCLGCSMKKPYLKEITDHQMRTRCLESSLQILYQYPSDSVVIYMYICNICNFAQLNEENVFKHLRDQHGRLQRDPKCVKEYMLAAIKDGSVHRVQLNTIPSSQSYMDQALFPQEDTKDVAVDNEPFIDDFNEHFMKSDQMDNRNVNNGTMENGEWCDFEATDSKIDIEEELFRIHGESGMSFVKIKPDPDKLSQ